VSQDNYHGCELPNERGDDQQYTPQYDDGVLRGGESQSQPVTRRILLLPRLWLSFQIGEWVFRRGSAVVVRLGEARVGHLMRMRMRVRRVLLVPLLHFPQRRQDVALSTLRLGVAGTYSGGVSQNRLSREDVHVPVTVHSGFDHHRPRSRSFLLDHDHKQVKEGMKEERGKRKEDYQSGL
jgi:hypothetical protein